MAKAEAASRWTNHTSKGWRSERQIPSDEYAAYEPVKLRISTVVRKGSVQEKRNGEGTPTKGGDRIRTMAARNTALSIHEFYLILTTPGLCFCNDTWFATLWEKRPDFQALTSWSLQLRRHVGRRILNFELFRPGARPSDRPGRYWICASQPASSGEAETPNIGSQSTSVDWTKVEAWLKQWSHATATLICIVTCSNSTLSLDSTITSDCHKLTWQEETRVIRD